MNAIQSHPKHAAKQRQRRRPLLNKIEFVNRHIGGYADRLSAYWEFENRHHLTPEANETFDRGQADMLMAHNPHSRTAFATIQSQHVAAHFRRLGPDFEGYWVTLAPPQFFIDETESLTFDHRELFNWVHRQLRGLHYIGMADLALYTNLQLVMGRKRAISWHVHVTVWGCSREEMRTRIQRINKQHPCAIPGRSTAHFKTYGVEGLLSRLFYAAALPQDNYRIIRQTHNQKTGEVYAVPHFRQVKGQLGPGDKSKFCQVLAHRRLEEVAFAGGEARLILAAVREEALAPWRAYRSRHPQAER